MSVETTFQNALIDFFQNEYFFMMVPLFEKFSAIAQ
jgi:hypothetical protein